ncbi:MAG: hypothetical protein HQK79_23050 [Desulfobacterales bacterium]|nr:hypothetical protein [Desulfobacterales bacterium]
MSLLKELDSNAVSISVLKRSYKKNVSLGQKLGTDDFKLMIKEYPELTFLVQSSQTPQLKRSPIETYGPHGQKIVQQGRLENSVEIPITFAETISGHLWRALRDWVINKKYLIVVMQACSSADLKWEILDSWIAIDGVDWSFEDGTAYKPNGTLYGQYFPEETLSISGMAKGLTTGAAKIGLDILNNILG